MAGQSSTTKSQNLDARKSNSVNPNLSKAEVTKALASKWNDLGKVGATPGSKSGTDALVRSGGQGSLQVSIAGVSLRLKSSHDEETVNELVKMVDEKVCQALPLTKTGSIQNAAILAALNMAEELLLLKRQTRELVNNLEAKVSRVIDNLEKSSPTA